MNSRLNSVAAWPELAKRCRYCAKTLAKRSKVSMRQLQRFFRSKFNQTPHEWLHALRMRLAVELMRDGSLVKEVAGLLGYRDTFHFSRDFKKYHGMPPTRYLTKFAVSNRRNVAF